MPIMFILDSASFDESEGSIHPNIRPKISFFTFGLWLFFIAFSPQKVKKMLTFLPVAAAPFASTKVSLLCYMLEEDDSVTYEMASSKLTSIV